MINDNLQAHDRELLDLHDGWDVYYIRRTIKLLINPISHSDILSLSLFRSRTGYIQVP